MNDTRVKVSDNRKTPITTEMILFGIILVFSLYRFDSGGRGNSRFRVCCGRLSEQRHQNVPGNSQHHSHPGPSRNVHSFGSSLCVTISIHLPLLRTVLHHFFSGHASRVHEVLSPLREEQREPAQNGQSATVPPEHRLANVHHLCCLLVASPSQHAQREHQAEHPVGLACDHFPFAGRSKPRHLSLQSTEQAIHTQLRVCR